MKSCTCPISIAASKLWRITWKCWGDSYAAAAFGLKCNRLRFVYGSGNDAVDNRLRGAVQDPLNRQIEGNRNDHVGSVGHGNRKEKTHDHAETGTLHDPPAFV